MAATSGDEGALLDYSLCPCWSRDTAANALLITSSLAAVSSAVHKFSTLLDSAAYAIVLCLRLSPKNVLQDAKEEMRSKGKKQDGKIAALNKVNLDLKVSIFSKCRTSEGQAANSHIAALQFAALQICCIANCCIANLLHC